MSLICFLFYGEQGQRRERMLTASRDGRNQELVPMCGYPIYAAAWTAHTLTTARTIPGGNWSAGSGLLIGVST